MWVQHSDDNMPKGTEGWQYVPELPATRMSRWSQALRRLVRGHRARVSARRPRGRPVVVTGLRRMPASGRHLHGALVRGYDATLVGDAHTTEDFRQWRARESRAGHRPHQLVLDGGGGTRAEGRHGPHCRGELRPT